MAPGAAYPHTSPPKKQCGEMGRHNGISRLSSPPLQPECFSPAPTAHVLLETAATAAEPLLPGLGRRSGDDDRAGPPDDDGEGGPALSLLTKDLEAVKSILTGSWINVMLVFVPLAGLSGVLGWGAVPTFTLNFLALIPLALVLGDVTEDLALRFGDVIGGLLNASFGNIVEIILSISALQKGLFQVVSASLLGSILSNLLLVLGFCFLFGGMYYRTQTFNELGNRTCSALLFLACIGVILPSAASRLIDGVLPDDLILHISRGTAIILLICYVCYLAFQLYTHHDLFCNNDEETEEPCMSLVCSLLMLTSITLIVAVASEFLTGSIEEVSAKTGLGEAFLGMIILPIAGNACEHITAVVVAMKNKMDLALGVAVGSSIQIALFAIPFTVIVAWIQDIPFTLDFDSFSALCLTLAVIHCNNITSDATSHWLLGVQLIAVYMLIALTYLYR